MNQELLARLRIFNKAWDFWIEWNQCVNPDECPYVDRFLIKTLRTLVYGA